MQNSLHQNVSIILLNYNGASDTIACLRSLLSITYSHFKIVIIDNASTDDSIERIERHLIYEELSFSAFQTPSEAMESFKEQKKITMIQTGMNVGYGYGNNVGIKYALKNSADYVLVLNNDTVVDPSFLTPLVQLCKEDPSVGIVSGKILYFEDKKKIWFNGGKFHKWTSRVEHTYFNEEDVGQIAPMDNTFISGCMWLIPVKIFEDVGFLNEDYFMYVEDLEFCTRVLDYNYRLVVSQDSIVYHKVGGASGGHWSSFAIYWMGRNSVKFIKSHVFGVRKFTSLFALLFLRPLKWLKKGEFGLIKEHFKGIYDGSKS